MPAFLKVKQLSGLSTSTLQRRQREGGSFDSAIVNEASGAPATTGVTYEIKLDVFKSRSSEVEMLQITWNSTMIQRVDLKMELGVNKSKKKNSASTW